MGTLLIESAILIASAIAAWLHPQLIWLFLIMFMLTGLQLHEHRAFKSRLYCLLQNALAIFVAFFFLITLTSLSGRLHLPDWLVLVLYAGAFGTIACYGRGKFTYMAVALILTSIVQGLLATWWLPIQFDRVGDTSMFLYTWVSVPAGVWLILRIEAWVGFVVHTK